MKVERLTSQEWSRFSEDAHLICFNEKRSASEEVIDFALLVVKDMVPQGYMTCRLIHPKVVHVHYGGAFPSSKGTSVSFQGYLLMLQALKDEGFYRGITYIDNANRSMLRFALKAGWTVTGLRTFEGSVLLEHSLMFEEMTA